MAHNTRVRADDAAWFTNSAVYGAEFAKIDRQLFGAITEAGGTWNLLSNIELLGNFAISTGKIASSIAYVGYLNTIATSIRLWSPIIKHEGGRIVEAPWFATLHNQHVTAGFARSSVNFEGYSEAITADFVNCTVLCFLATGSEQSVRLLNDNCLLGDIITVSNSLPPDVSPPGPAPVGLLVKNDSGITIAALGRDQWADCMFNGTQWQVLRKG